MHIIRVYVNRLRVFGAVRLCGPSTETSSLSQRFELCGVAVVLSLGKQSRQMIKHRNTLTFSGGILFPNSPSALMQP